MRFKAIFADNGLKCLMRVLTALHHTYKVDATSRRAGLRNDDELTLDLKISPTEIVCQMHGFPLGQTERQAEARVICSARMHINDIFEEVVVLESRANNVIGLRIDPEHFARRLKQADEVTGCVHSLKLSVSGQRSFDGVHTQSRRPVLQLASESRSLRHVVATAATASYYETPCQQLSPADTQLITYPEDIGASIPLQLTNVQALEMKLLALREAGMSRVTTLVTINETEMTLLRNGSFDPPPLASLIFVCNDYFMRATIQNIDVETAPRAARSFYWDDTNARPRELDKDSRPANPDEDSTAFEVSIEFYISKIVIAFGLARLLDLAAHLDLRLYVVPPTSLLFAYRLLPGDTTSWLFCQVDTSFFTD